MNEDENMEVMEVIEVVLWPIPSSNDKDTETFNSENDLLTRNAMLISNAPRKRMHSSLGGLRDLTFTFAYSIMNYLNFKISNATLLFYFIESSVIC